MLRLISPSVEYYSAFMRAVDDYRENDSSALLEYRYREGAEDFDTYVQDLHNHEMGVNLPPGYIPQSHYWLVHHDKIVGFSRLRHYLVPFLEEIGGHIGFNVPPGEQRKGYATTLLGLTLKKAWERGIDPVLVTADDDNISSIRVIQKNNGIQDSRTTIDPESGKTVLRFWIHRS